MNKTTLNQLSRDEKYFCLEKSELQEKLRFTSILYLITGGFISTIVFIINLATIVFFMLSKKTKKSPICIYIFFLSIFNMVNVFNYLLTALVKLKIINTESQKYEFMDDSSKANDYFCKWYYFLSNFSGHICVYLVLLIQLQNYLAVRKNVSFNLFLYNYALAYFICVSLILTFFVVDEFYLYDSYFLTMIYCPLTLVFTCVFNEKFKLLNSVKFNTLFYHHLHTFLYNLVPFVLIIVINVKLIASLKSKKTKLKNVCETSLYSGFRKQTLDRLLSSDSRENNKGRNSKSQILKKSASADSIKQNLGYIVKRPKKVEFTSRLSVIFMHQSDVGYLSVFVSFLQVINTFPKNILSYLTEWNMETMQVILNSSTNSSLGHGHFHFNSLENVYVNIPVIGEKKRVSSQAQIGIWEIMAACLEMFNFNIFVVFQYFVCKGVKEEFNKFLIKFKFLINHNRENDDDEI